jgi:FKBP-type peptidyl-prolyl cis-trans isomerase
MKATLIVLSVIALMATGCFEKGAGKLGKEPKTDTEKTIYTLGQMDSRRLQNFDLSADEFQVWVKGVKDGLDGDTGKIDMQAFSKEISKLGDERSKRVAESEKKEALNYLAKMKKEEGAEVLASGVIFQNVKEGEGEMPAADSMVKVHYHGTLRSGEVFDSSVDRGSPATFPLNRVIPCWTEAVQKIKVGGKAKVTCPSDKAYGDRGAPPKIKPGAALTFDIELLEIVKTAEKK